MSTLAADVPTHASALFPEIELDEPVAASSVKGPFAQVALEQAVDKTLTYTVPPRLEKLIRAGQRVLVPLGRKNRTQFGYVVALREAFDAASAGVAAGKLKAVKDIADERVLVDAPLMELALWIARYYCCALGLVLESMIPGAVKKKIGVGYTSRVSLAIGRDQAQELLETTKAPKRRALLARLLQAEPGGSIEVVRLAGEAGVTPPTVRRLAKLGVVSIATEADLDSFGSDGATKRRSDEGSGTEAPHELNADQARVFAAIAPAAREQKFGTHLVLGVTGSGKTEVYLRLMAETVAQGRQAVMLVPEIALTPQTVRRITARFSRVAVLHSGLSATMRHRYWQQIASGQADVVVGARSAVFAPVPNPGLFVVDEEEHLPPERAGFVGVGGAARFGHHRGFQRAGVPDAGGPAVAGDCAGVYEDEILERYRPLFAQRSASSRMASSYSSKNSATNSITSGEGLFRAGSIRMPPFSEPTVTSSPGSQRSSLSISVGIGTITDPPTFFKVRSIFMEVLSLGYMQYNLSARKTCRDRIG